MATPDLRKLESEVEKKRNLFDAAAFYAFKLEGALGAWNELSQLESCNEFIALRTRARLAHVKAAIEYGLAYEAYQTALNTPLTEAK